MTGTKPRRHRRRATAGLTGLVLGLLVLVALPLSGRAMTLDAFTERLTSPVAGLLETEEPGAPAIAGAPETGAPVQSTQQQDPKTEPPIHGTNPHGQGTVAVVDLQPDPERPQGGDPSGSDSGEEVVVGRARGEQNEDGTYHGHITIVALFGNEVLGVDTDPGETEAGPLNAVQEGILDAICDGSGNQVCVSVLRADSTTDENGSTNHFSAAHATIGGQDGIDVGAAESNGNISDDGNCQTAHGDSSVANASVGGQAVAGVARSSTDSQACKGQAGTQTNDSRVLELGGTGVPLPAAGCADGTPDVVTGVPTIAPIVCNADENNGGQSPSPYGVREALSVFVLDAGGTQVGKAMTAGSESRAQAPPPQCSDKGDNDGDGKADAADPGCLSGPGGAYNPNDDNESDESGAQCSDTVDNDGDGVADAADPGCHTDGDASNPASYDPNDNDETDPGETAGEGGGGPGRDRGSADRAECSDRDDNDGDGLTDRADPGCHTDGDAGNPDSYDPDDDSEADGGGAPACSNGGDDDGDGLVDRADPGCLSGPGGTYNPDDDDESDARRELGALAMTGSETLLLGIAGLLLLAAGLDLRRRLRTGAHA